MLISLLNLDQNVRFECRLMQQKLLQLAISLHFYFDKSITKNVRSNCKSPSFYSIEIFCNVNKLMRVQKKHIKTKKSEILKSKFMKVYL